MSNQITIQDQVKAGLTGEVKSITSLLNGDKEKANKFLATAYHLSGDYNLRNCNPQSIVKACVDIAQLNLSIDKRIGHAYVVPYKNVAQVQIGYKGMAQLLKRSGYIVKAYPIYDIDAFGYSFDGFDFTVSYEPNFDDIEESFKWQYEHLIGVLTVVKDIQTGEISRRFTTKAKIEKLRQSSPNQKGAPSGVWQDWFADMAQAKAIKQHAKLLPIGDEVSLAFAKEDEPYTIEATAEPKEDLNKKLGGAIAQKTTAKTDKTKDTEETQPREAEEAPEQEASEAETDVLDVDAKTGEVQEKKLTPKQELMKIARGRKGTPVDVQKTIRDMSEEDAARWLSDAGAVEEFMSGAIPL